MESRIPSEQECLELMAEIGLASAVVHHSILVNKFAMELARDLKLKSIAVNTELLSAAALLHDIMKLDAEVCHGQEGGEFLRKKGFPEVARVVETHCLNNVDDDNLCPKTTEEKLLMYADLRISTGRVVSLDERFDYIKERYKPKNPDKFKEYMDFAKQLESEILSMLKKEE